MQPVVVDDSVESVSDRYDSCIVKLGPDRGLDQVVCL